MKGLTLISFSDSRVNMAARGLNVLKEVDADGDGKINTNDFAYSHLRIWQDVNHDGQAQGFELQTLQSLGISELNIGTGQFTRAESNYKFDSTLRIFHAGELAKSLLKYAENDANWRVAV